MSHEKIDHEHTFNCDHRGCNKNCGGTGEFRTVWSEAKEESWVNASANGVDWEHYCPDHASAVGG